MTTAEILDAAILPQKLAFSIAVRLLTPGQRNLFAAELVRAKCPRFVWPSAPRGTAGNDLAKVVAEAERVADEAEASLQARLVEAQRRHTEAETKLQERITAAEQRHAATLAKLRQKWAELRAKAPPDTDDTPLNAGRVAKRLGLDWEYLKRINDHNRLLHDKGLEPRLWCEGKTTTRKIRDWIKAHPYFSRAGIRYGAGQRRRIFLPAELRHRLRPAA